MSDINIDYRKAQYFGSNKTVSEPSCPSYDDFVKLWPYDILWSARKGSYQGTFIFLLRNEEGKVVLMDLSFGSCSHCDFLSDVLKSGYKGNYIDDDNVEDIEQYFEKKRKGIVWKEKDKLIEDLHSPDNVNYNIMRMNDDDVEQIEEILNEST